MSTNQHLVNILFTIINSDKIFNLSIDTKKFKLSDNSRKMSFTNRGKYGIIADGIYSPKLLYGKIKRNAVR